MWPKKFWHQYENVIRKGAGLGTAPELPDQNIYDKRNQHCEVLVVGGGPAGISAALEAGRAGARVILVDEQAELGGALLGRVRRAFVLHAALHPAPRVEVRAPTSPPPAAKEVPASAPAAKEVDVDEQSILNN